MLTDLLKNEILCFDVREKTLRYVVTKYNRNQSLIDIKKYGTVIFSDECVVQGVLCENPTTITTLSNLVMKEKISTKNVYINISSPSIVLRMVKIPLMEERDLTEYLSEEISQYLPIDTSSSMIDFKILDIFQENDAKMMNVMLISAPKLMIERYVSLFKKAGLNPLVVDIYPNSISRVFSKLSGKNIAIVDVNTNTLDFIILKNSKLFMHSSVYLANTIEYILKEEQDIEQLIDEDPCFKAGFDEILDYVKTYLNFYASRHFGASVDGLYILGDLSFIKKIDNYLSSMLRMTVLPGLPDVLKIGLLNSGFSASERQNFGRIALYACGVGLAMRGT